jgi:hypothetical protein
VLLSYGIVPNMVSSYGALCGRKFDFVMFEISVGNAGLMLFLTIPAVESKVQKQCNYVGPPAAEYCFVIGQIQSPPFHTVSKRFLHTEHNPVLNWSSRW